MKFDLAALLSLSRPLRAGRGLAVAANSVFPFAVRFLIPPQPFLPLLPRAALFSYTPFGVGAARVVTQPGAGGGPGKFEGFRFAPPMGYDPAPLRG